jgi:hypothetical protein
VVEPRLCLIACQNGFPARACQIKHGEIKG